MDKKKGGRLIPALCGVAGTIILAAVILVCLPMTLPRLLGYEIYNVVSGSMEPEIPTGSVVYVKKAEPETIEKGEIIAFRRGDAVVVHRVVSNRKVEGNFITRGDANEQEDMDDVDYAMLIGRVDSHYPVIGGIMALLAETIGKVYLLCFAVCGVMFHMLAARLKERKNDENNEKDETATEGRV